MKLRITTTVKSHWQVEDESPLALWNAINQATELDAALQDSSGVFRRGQRVVFNPDHVVHVQEDA